MVHPLRIAIPEPTSTDPEYNQRSLPQYVDAVTAAGGTPVTISLKLPADEQAALANTCSAILLPGSPADVDPARYGETPAAETAAKDVPRELMDNLLLSRAFEQGKPILGICYGLQSLNVWRQGTLIQDLPHSSASTKVNHDPGRAVQDAHPLRIAPNSRLARLVRDGGTGSLSALVNSSHHQAIAIPGGGLTVAAVSPEDGVIEALEGEKDDQFVVAVQWHPERTLHTNSLSRLLFAAFLQAAEGWETRHRIGDQ